jgi:hypothetical protein
MEPGLAEVLDRLVPGVAPVPDWEDVLRRADAHVPLRRNRRVWYALAAAAILTAIIVNPAFGLGERILDFFTGSPAPEPVKQELAFGSNAGDRAVDELMRQQVTSQVLVGQARGLLAVSTPVGLLRVWGAPTSDGGLCTYMLLEGVARGWLSCDTLGPDADPLGGGALAHSVSGRTVRYVSGQAREDIASVEVRLADGTTLPVRMAGHFYLRALFPGQQPVALVGRDASGGIVAETPVSLGQPTILPPTMPTGPARKLLELQTRIGPVTLEAAPGPGGKRCWIVTAEGSQATGCRAVPRGVEFDFGPYYSPDQSRRIVVLAGLVGRGVRSLDLRLEDGKSIQIALIEGYFLYELPRKYWTAGHRPTLLVARDAEGLVLGRRRIVPEGL